jgi:hypothetical protein
MMRHWRVISFAVTGFTATLLAGCGAAGQQFNSAAPFNSTQRDVGSWMRPAGRKSTLIYAGGFYGGVYVYDYFTGKQVGKLNAHSDGMCVDAKGDVYVTQLSGTTLEYAHGATKVLRTFNSGGAPAGCSLDGNDDLAVTSARPADVTIFAGGDPNKGTTYSDSACTFLYKMGYDDKGNLMGLGGNATSGNVVCALLAGSQKEATFSMEGFTIGAAGSTTWDGKYIALSDQDVDGKATSGIVQASLSGSTLVSHGESLLTDPCTGGPTDVTAPLIVGAKNTPVNHRQGKVAIGINSACEAKGSYQIAFWSYPKGGNPFKAYKANTPMSGAVVSMDR